jgi:hypothetical protein
MRTTLSIILAATVVTTGALATSALAADTKAASAECAKIEARYENAARGKAGTQDWMSAEYWATEGKSYCETGYTRDGVEAYRKALDELKGG